MTPLQFGDTASAERIRWLMAECVGKKKRWERMLMVLNAAAHGGQAPGADMELYELEHRGFIRRQDGTVELTNLGAMARRQLQRGGR